MIKCRYDITREEKNAKKHFLYFCVRMRKATENPRKTTTKLYLF